MADSEGWISVAERLPTGEDAVSCEAWCVPDDPLGGEDEHAGPCVMAFDPDEEPGLRWQSREDTGCWEPGEVTHWRPRPRGPELGMAAAAIGRAAYGVAEGEPCTHPDCSCPAPPGGGLPQCRAAAAAIERANGVMVVTPWPDYAGHPIRAGNTIQHPSGERGRVVFLAHEKEPGDQWRVDYGGGSPLSRLGLQIGDKGMAVVVPDGVGGQAK